MDSSIIFFLIVLLFSIVIHEVSHGSVANLLGDPTAKLAGRLTLNPIKHLDPVGSVLVPIMLLIFTAGHGPIFGWAKPVPINPYNLRNQKWGELLVSGAGPGSNIMLALIFGLAIRFLSLPTELLAFFSIIVLINLLLGIFNLVPIPPLDGSHIMFRFLPESLWKLKAALQQYGLFILIFFLFFGLSWVFLFVTILYHLITGRYFVI